MIHKHLPALLLATVLALSPGPAHADIKPPPAGPGSGMATNAANATLPDARSNLALGTASTPQFQAGTLAGGDTATTPIANAIASYLRLTNTTLTGGVGAQVQFGSIAGNPYATFGTALTDGSNNSTGDLVWGIRNGSAGAITERLRLSSSTGNLILAPTAGFTTGGIMAPGSSVFGGSVVGGALQNTVNTVQINNNFGQPAEASSSYSSDNTSGALGSTIRAYHTAVNNHPSSSKTVWNTYNETHVTKQASVNQTFGEESSLYNRGVVATLDPYTTNLTAATENFRVDCGVGTFVGNITASSSGTTLTITVINSGAPYNGQVVTGAGVAADTELVRQLTGNPQTGVGTWETSVSNTVASETMTLAMDPKNCTVGFHLLNNGAAYRHGIIIGSDALDTAAGRIAPALAMGQNHSLSWYSAAGTEAWKMFSNATAAGGNIQLGNAGSIVIGGATGGPVNLLLNPASAGQQSLVTFEDANTAKWQIGKQPDNSFILFDNANSLTAMAITTAGNTTLGETGKTVTVNGLTATNASLTTPALGAASATTINKVTLTPPASGSTLTIADGKTATHTSTTTFAGVDGKTLTLNNSLTLAGTDATTQTFQASDTIVGRSTTDTLTNKTLTDPIIQEFEVSTGTLTKTTDTALATVPGLSQALTAGKTYNCRGHLTGTAGASGGIKVALVATASLSATQTTWTGFTWNGTTAVSNTTATALGANIAAATAVYSDVYIDGSIVVNVAGTINVQAAQNASNGTATTVLQGSTFSCVRVN